MTEPRTESAVPASASEGAIFLVGIGPGHAEHMSARARAAIVEAEIGRAHV